MNVVVANTWEKRFERLLNDLKCVCLFEKKMGRYFSGREIVDINNLNCIFMRNTNCANNLDLLYNELSIMLETHPSILNLKRLERFEKNMN